jgi:hypothetical protein
MKSYTLLSTRIRDAFLAGHRKDLRYLIPSPSKILSREVNSLFDRLAI